jgi:hypothetical protein
MEVKEEGDKLYSETSTSTCLLTHNKTHALEKLLVYRSFVLMDMLFRNFKISGEVFQILKS